MLSGICFVCLPQPRQVPGSASTKLFAQFSKNLKDQASSDLSSITSLLAERRVSSKDALHSSLSEQSKCDTAAVMAALQEQGGGDRAAVVECLEKQAEANQPSLKTMQAEMVAHTERFMGELINNLSRFISSELIKCSGQNRSGGERRR